jgi:sigma-E factor negative regulatory protein RseC
MQTLARVHDVHEGRVRLACESAASACDACSGGRGCALRWLARPGGTMLEVEMPCLDGRPLLPGDRLVLEVDDGELLRAALLAYVPPLIGLLAGSGVATFLVPGSEPAALIAAVLGLVTGWGTARLWLRHAPPRYRLRPEVAA